VLWNTVTKVKQQTDLTNAQKSDLNHKYAYISYQFHWITATDSACYYDTETWDYSSTYVDIMKVPYTVEKLRDAAAMKENF